MDKSKHIISMYLQFQEIIKGCYPPFIWKNGRKGFGEKVPVFMFHEVNPKDFEEKLHFLKTNHYTTVTTDEVYEFIVKGKNLSYKAIMLTFDDGRKSVWTVAYPLLKRYDFRATVFIAPKIIELDEVCTPNLDDVWKGKCGLDKIMNCDRGSSPLISWGEARAMHSSDVIDFQSHSLDHRKIPVSPKIVNFVNPRLIDNYYFEFDIPWMKGYDLDVSEHSQILGAPVYKNYPFLQEKRMYIEDSGLRDECIEYVHQNGGYNFFEKKDWHKNLKEVVKRYRNRNPKDSIFETVEEQEERITLNMKKAKQIIEDRLPGKQVNHLAYPWGAGSQMSINSSKKVGYVSNFWVTIPHKSQNLPGDDPFRMVRLKHDFIWRLPGRGRKSLMDIFLLKFLRRKKGKIDY